MANLTLPGLPDLGSAERASAPTLAEALFEMAWALRSVDAAPLAAAAGLPLAEVLASPFALRAIALGVSVGATHRHRELRRALPLPGPPEVQDPDHDAWSAGVLQTGKYQGFSAEAPFAVYDPSHISKWAPHEMTHRAAGFFFRREASRFERYLGARLNELVPVVLFHTFEQALRLEDEGPFDRHAAGRAPAATLARCLWRTDDEPRLRARCEADAQHLIEGFAHFARELAAIDEELTSGLCVRAPHPSLDASSDALAYVVGHDARLRHRPVARALEAVDSADREADVGAYRERIGALFERLLFGTVELDLGLAAARRAARERWDLALRTAVVADDEAAVEAVLEAVEPRDAVPEESQEAVLEDGSATGLALDQLAEGLEACVPAAWSALGDDEAFEAFAESRALWDRAPLARRALALFEGRPALLDLARFEGALLEARLADEGGARLRPHAARIHLSLTHEVLDAHAAYYEGGEVRPRSEPCHVLVVGATEGVAVAPLSPRAGAVLAALDGVVERAELTRRLLASGLERAEADDTIDALLRCGALSACV